MPRGALAVGAVAEGFVEAGPLDFGRADGAIATLVFGATAVGSALSGIEGGEVPTDAEVVGVDAVTEGMAVARGDVACVGSAEAGAGGGGLVRSKA